MNSEQNRQNQPACSAVKLAVYELKDIEKNRTELKIDMVSCGKPQYSISIFSSSNKAKKLFAY